MKEDKQDFKGYELVEVPVQTDFVIKNGDKVLLDREVLCLMLNKLEKIEKAVGVK